MFKLDVFNLKREKVDNINLLDDIFNVEVKPYLLHEVVVWQLAKRRMGTASTKIRSEVRGGGRKPWRQKGTGRARAGSKNSPLWRGGGTTFGPKPRSYSYSLPKKVRKKALKMALSDRLSSEKVIVLKDFPLTEIKTKTFVEVLDRFEVKRSSLVVIPVADKILEKSSRNIPNVKVLRVEGLNVYDILRYDNLLFLESAIKKLEEILL